MTDSAGYVTQKYDYDAYGAVLWHEKDANFDQPYQYIGQLGYYTHYQEPDLALLQLGVRLYDPQVGRFTQRDPARSGFDQYAYANCNPLRSIDPSGRRDIKVCRKKGGIANLSHYWVCLTGDVNCWGFRPVDQKGANAGHEVPGYVRLENDQMDGSQTCSHTSIPECAFKQLRNAISGSGKDPNLEYLAGNSYPPRPYNCIGWIRDMFGLAGISEPHFL